MNRKNLLSNPLILLFKTTNAPFWALGKPDLPKKCMHKQNRTNQNRRNHMKFNKWTLGLAAVGAVSLTSVAQAEEKASMVQTAVNSTTLSGYVDTSINWNPGDGNAHQPAYAFNGP